MSTLCSVLILSTTGVVFADPIGKKGVTNYVTHFMFRPVLSMDVPGLGSGTLLVSYKYITMLTLGARK
jgi:hypothetical protein